MLTLDAVVPLLDGLDDFDRQGFAARVAKLDPVLGYVLGLYAVAVYGGPPDKVEWPLVARQFASELERDGITTVADARRWWQEQYGDGAT